MKTLFLHPPSFDGFDGGAGGPQQTLRIMKEIGLRTDIARRFTRDCRKLGITIHGIFIFRPRKIAELTAELTAEMMTSWEMTKRRLREGAEFFRFLRAREA